MAYKDFNLEHTQQLMSENAKYQDELKQLREQLTQRDQQIRQKDNLIFKQTTRLHNIDETARKMQKSSGQSLGFLNLMRIIKPE